MTTTNNKPGPAGTHQLAASLAGYEAEIELECIRVMSGGLRRTKPTPDLSSLCRHLLHAAPEVGPLLIRLVSAHRRLTREVLRPDRLYGTAVAASRRQWADALAELRQHVAGMASKGAARKP